MNKLYFWIRKLAFCKNCGRYTTFIKDKDGWYCGVCGDYK